MMPELIWAGTALTATVFGGAWVFWWGNGKRYPYHHYLAMTAILATVGFLGTLLWWI